MLPARISKQKAKLAAKALQEVHALDWKFRDDGALVSTFSRPLPDRVIAIIHALDSGEFRSKPIIGDDFDLILEALEVYNTAVVDNVDIPWSTEIQELSVELSKIKPRPTVS